MPDLFASDSTGIMDGGIQLGNSVLVTGMSGTGTSVLAVQFITEGSRYGEAGLVLRVVARYQHPKNRSSCPPRLTWLL
jgi:hypothetical protein